MKEQVRIARESRELIRLENEAKRHKGRFYLLFAMVMLTVIYIVDEITSNVNSAMQPYALFDLFRIASRDVNSAEYKAAINTVAPWQVASNLFLIITPFYKALSDRFGRRPFLMINTIGMGVGMLIVMTSKSTVQYILGMLFMMFFTPNDMQVLYIMETAPKEKRASYAFIAKGIALISVSLIGVMFFSMTMSVTLALLVSVLPRTPGLAFGLTTIGLFLGTAPIFFFRLTTVRANGIMIAVLTAVCLLAMQVMIRKDGKRHA